MTVKRQKSEIIGAIGTTIFHFIVLVILLLCGFSRILPEEEEGIEVMFGNINEAQGTFQPRNTGVTPIAQTTPPPTPQPIQVVTPPSKEDLLTQDMEETIAMAERQKKKEEEKKRKEEEARKKKIEEQKKLELQKQQAEAKQKAEQLAKQQAEAEEAARQKAAEEARIAAEKKKMDEIKKKASGAFGAGTSKGSKGTGTGTGNQGSPFGNSDKGANQGTGGWGSFSLNGRSLGGEGLPRPAYQVQEEGTIVVDIVVNAEGKVINATIGRGTDIDNATMRRASIEAAKKAVFNSIEGSNNQSGTITYKFNLR